MSRATGRSSDVSRYDAWAQVMEENGFQHDIDARGLRCPEPVMLLHARIRKALAGEIIRVRADDPASDRDIPAFCENLGHTLLAREEHASERHFFVRKRSA